MCPQNICLFKPDQLAVADGTSFFCSVEVNKICSSSNNINFFQKSFGNKIDSNIFRRNAKLSI